MKKVFSATGIRSWWSAIAAGALCVTAIFFAAASMAGPMSKAFPSVPKQSSKALSAPTAGPAWSLVTSPNVTPNTISAVTCVSSSDCWATGNWLDLTTGISRPMTEHWNGLGWSIVPAPSATTTFSSKGNLQSVACASTILCFAVGEYQTNSGVQQPLIERWDGLAWTIVAANTSPTQNNYLTKVTCTSASDCWAVGSIDPGTGYQNLTVHWNGTAWAVVASPNTSVSQSNGLAGVTCVSASLCWAVGNYSNGTISQTLILKWNGASWSIATSPNTSTSITNALLSVSCTSSTDCWAVGVSQPSIYQTLTEHWDGVAWSIVASPSAGASQDNILYDVKCVSSVDCSAIGYYFTAGGSQTLTEHWNGTAWSIVASPNASPDNYLYSIACSSGSDCWGFGYFNMGTGNEVLALRWNGSAWSLFSSTNLGMTGTQQSNSLGATTCFSARDCWAVGSYHSGAVDQTLTLHWNGSSWAVISSPSTSVTENNSLAAITCAAANDCWAVGAYTNSVSGFVQTLIEHWNGSAWSIFSSPNANTAGVDGLSGVACLSSTDCFAVGTYVNSGSFNQTLVLRWNGANWSIITSPNSSTTQQNVLSGVTCVSSVCWAVGYYQPASVNQVLVEKWDGVSWSIFGSSNTSPSQTNALSSVSCPSASQCFAAGNYIASGVGRTLIETWNGPSSSILPSPNSDATHSNSLSGIFCTSAAQCWAVGNYLNAAGSLQQALVEQWDGGSWTITPSRTLAISNILNGVFCSSTANCWAAGLRNSGSTFQTLLHEYSLTVPPLGSVSSRLSHGVGGVFDADLRQTGARPVECRSGGAGNDYTLIFNFANSLTSVNSVSATGTGSITGESGGPNPNQVTVHVTGVTNTNSITVTLNGVVDAESNSGSVGGTLSVLLGDTNGDASVNSADIGQTKSKSGQLLDITNFRQDVNVDGSINSADISLVKSRSGTALP